MLKSGMESLASSADSIDNSNDSINYAKMIEIFRRYDKKCCGYLNKSQYKKFLHDMKIYQTEEFGEITFRALVTENQVNDKNKSEVNDDNLLLSSSGTEPGITFEMARVICETFGPSSDKIRSRRSSNASIQPNILQSNDSNNENRSRRSSNTSIKPNILLSNNNNSKNSSENNNNNDSNKSESNNLQLKESENEANNESSEYQFPTSQSGSSINSYTESSKSAILKFERNASAPLPNESSSNDFLPFFKKTNKQKPEKKGLKTKICSLILFRGVDVDRDGKIDFDQFKSIANIVDPNLSDDDINALFESCMPDSERNLVTYANVAKQLFDVFVWGNEDPFQQKIVNNAPISRICLLI